jgi:methyltransferase-like protein 23
METTKTAPENVLPTRDDVIAIGDRRWRVRHVGDQDALLLLSEGRERFPFGLMLWDSAIALARWIADDGRGVSGKSVLELGAGVGLPGLVAANLGAVVTQTDHDAQALELAGINAALNGICEITVRMGDWFAWDDQNRYDVIIGADIVYDGADHDAVLGLLERLLNPGGRVVLADPQREKQAQFVAAARSAGWRITRTQVSVATGYTRREGSETPITVLELTR